MDTKSVPLKLDTDLEKVLKRNTVEEVYTCLLYTSFRIFAPRLLFYGGRTNWRLVFINIRQRERVNGCLLYTSCANVLI